MKKVFISGGTGYVGSALVKLLKESNCKVLFSWHQNLKKSQELCESTGFQSICTDLSGDISPLKEKLRDFQPNVFIHCAASCENIKTSNIDNNDWQKVQAVNCYSAFEISQSIIESMSLKKEGDIVFINGLANCQSFKLPVHFAASQGAQNAMAVALAKEYGKSGIRVNSLTLGLLESGLSRKFPEKLHKDYLTFSALQRKGTADEAASAIYKFALFNSYVSGKNICITGGI